MKTFCGLAPIPNQKSWLRLCKVVILSGAYCIAEILSASSSLFTSAGFTTLRAMLQLVLKCGYFHSRLVLYIFCCFRFYFLLVMDIAKSETFRSFTILNKDLLFLIKLNKTAVQSIPNITLVRRIFDLLRNCRQPTML